MTELAGKGLPLQSVSSAGRWMPLAACLLLIALVAGIYSNSLNGEFVFDDLTLFGGTASPINVTPSQGAMSAFHVIPSAPSAGRPVVQLSLALNYALGNKLWGYHAFNMLVHALAAMALFGLVRRTLLGGKFRERYGGWANGLAFACAALWAAHPLQTESVSYISQRAESLAGLFYLLCMYCAARRLQSGGTGWGIAAVASCALGMASKETVITAPLMVLLYDRTFASGTFRAALRRHWRLYAGLAATWAVAACLIAVAPRSNTAGFGLKEITPLDYAASQCGVILKYLCLSFWPGKLALDYGWPAASSAGEIVPGAVVLGLLLGLTIWAFVRFPAAGFFGAWFFITLAPSSSFVPIADRAFEHRMYLPLAGLAAAMVFAVVELLRGMELHRKLAAVTALLLLAGVATAMSWRTMVRNEDFATEVSIWRANVKVRPENFRGRLNLALALSKKGYYPQAVAAMKQALSLKPDSAAAMDVLGVFLMYDGHIDEAIDVERSAMEIDPNLASVHLDLAVALDRRHAGKEALPHYQRAAELNPKDADTRSRLADALCSQSKFDEAIEQYKETLLLDPNMADAHANLGSLLVLKGRNSEAIEHFRRAIAIKPQSQTARLELGKLLLDKSQADEAAEHLTIAAKLMPNDADVLYWLGVAKEKQGQAGAAVECYSVALALDPHHSEAMNRLEALIAAGSNATQYRAVMAERHRKMAQQLQAKQPATAAAHYALVVRFDPTDAKAHNNLATLLWRAGDANQAVAHFRQAVRLRPSYAEAHFSLGGVLESLDKTPEAIAEYQAAIDAAPSFAEARYYLASLLARGGRDTEAAAQFKAALSLRPDWPEVLCEYSLMLASSPDVKIRNGQEAQRLAEVACKLTQRKVPQPLDSLAAAYAEQGEFEVAVATAKQALGLTADDKQMAADIQARIKLYESRQPYRQKK